MSTIESHEKYYKILKDYLSPEEVKSLINLPPKNPLEYQLYHTAHCYVSERYEKGDLVDLIYVLLKKHYGA